MPQPYRPLVQRTQPKGQPRLRQDSLYRAGLTFAMPHPIWGDIVTGNKLTFGSGGGVSLSGAGQSLTGNGSAAAASIPLNLSISYRMSMAFWLEWNAYSNADNLAMELTANTNTNDGAFMVDPNASAGNFQLYSRITSGANGKAVSFTRPSAGLHHYYFVLDRNAAGGGWTVYVDGLPVTTTSIFTASNTSVLANSTLYLFSRAGTSLFASGKLTNLCFWNYPADDAVAREFYRGGGGWQMYEPDGAVVSFAVPSAGGGTVTGNASITPSPQTLTSSGAVSVGGTLNNTPSAQTTTASGAVAVAGTATITPAAQTATASGIVTSGVVGSVNISPAAQTTTASGAVAVGSSASITLSPQTLTGAATVSGGAVTGTASITPTAQTIIAAGNIIVAATANITPARQTLTAGEAGTLPSTVPDSSRTIDRDGFRIGSASISADRSRLGTSPVASRRPRLG